MLELDQQNLDNQNSRANNKNQQHYNGYTSIELHVDNHNLPSTTINN